MVTYGTGNTTMNRMHWEFTQDSKCSVYVEVGIVAIHRIKEV